VELLILLATPLCGALSGLCRSAALGPRTKRSCSLVTFLAGCALTYASCAKAISCSRTSSSSSTLQRVSGHAHRLGGAHDIALLPPVHACWKWITDASAPRSCASITACISSL